MNLVTCPSCFKASGERIPDAIYVLKNGELKPLGGWFCAWCCQSWISDKKERKKFKAAQKGKT